MVGHHIGLNKMIPDIISCLNLSAAGVPGQAPVGLEVPGKLTERDRGIMENIVLKVSYGVELA